MPQIETEEQLKEWLETQDWQICTAIAARAALRSLPTVMGDYDQNRESDPKISLLLVTFRTVLTSAGTSTCPPVDLKGLVSAAGSAARSADSAAHSTSRTGYSAARSTSRSELAARSATYSAVVRDAQLMANTSNPQERAKQIFRHPLWHDDHGVAEFQKMWLSFQAEFGADSPWSFWCDWYRAMLAGQPMDWALQRLVALTDQKTWNKGPEAVAEEIEQFKGEFEPQLPKEPRFPAFEPNDLRPLIQNRIIATASLQGLAVQISGAIEQYHADTGANALPEALAPLQDMPALVNAVANTLAGIHQPDNVRPETEQDLRAEIGRLNAKVAELEKNLDAARSAKPSPFTDALKKQLGTSLGDWKLYAAICGTALMLNSDDGTLRGGWESLLNIRQDLFGDVSSPPKSIAPEHTPSTDSFEI